ncbi:MAG TPA: putative Ig domain-containing protein [Bryobacteraceae bacterium]
MKTQACLKTPLAFVAAIILLCPSAATAAATTALVPPALTPSDNAGNSVTIDGTGAATCAGSCTTMISGAGSPGALTWSGQLGLFTISAASGQSKPALSPPQINLTLLVTTGSWSGSTSNPVLHAMWSDVGFSGTGPMTMAVSPLIPERDFNAVYTGYVDNTNALFGTGTTVGTIGPTNIGSSTTITGAGPTSEPFSMTEDVVVSMSQDASFTVSFNLIAVPQPALALGCPSASGESGVPYDSHLTVRGGIPPYSFSISGGLPAVLVLNPSTGEISGSQTAAGSFSFTAEVTDSSRDSGQAQCHIVFTTPPAPLE